MRIKNFLLLLFLFCFCQNDLLSQNQRRIVDSLLIILKTKTEDTSKVNILNDLSLMLFEIGKFRESKKHADSALTLAEKLKFKKGIAESYSNIGAANLPMGNNTEAFKNHQVSVKIKEEIGDRKGIAVSYNNIGHIYYGWANYHEGLKIHLAALKIFEEIGDRKGIADSHHNIGFVYSNQGNYSEAIKNYRTSLKIREEIGDRKGIAESYNNIGIYYHNLGKYAEALKYHRTSLKIKVELGDLRGTAFSYNGIGNVYSKLGNYTEALANHLLALKLREEIGDMAITASYVNIGVIYFNQGNFPEALKNFQEVLKICTHLGDKRGIVISHSFFGNIFFRQANYSEALKSHQLALKIQEEIGDKPRIAASYIDIGNIYMIQGYYIEALKNYQEALRLYEIIGEKDGIASSYINLGSLSIKSNKPAEAKIYFQKGLLIAKEIGEKELVKDAYKGMATLDSAKGNYQNALVQYQLYIKYKDSLFNEINSQHIAQMKEQYESEKKDREILLLIGEKQKLENENQVTALLIKAKEDSLNFVQSEKEKIRLEKEKTDALNLYHQQEIALLDKERKLQELELTEEKLKKGKAIEIEKLKYEFALDEENTRHQQVLATEKANQQIKDVEAKTLLQKEKAEKKRRTEAFTFGIIGLVLLSIFTVVIIRQRNAKKRAVEKAEAGHKMAELELQSLRAQLNPHFMFNSLNAIQDLIVNENSEKSHLYLSRFSKLLRMLLDNANQPFVTVKQELELLELYLSLENLRIPNLQYSIEKDPKLNADERMIPNMMLQPYIENAIWHGLSNKKGERKLQIRINENGNATEFEVEDNGIGRKRSDELKQQFRHGHHSKGMQLLSKRFELLSKEYGTSIQTTITDLESNGDATGTLVKIDVPFTLSEQAQHLANDTNHHN